MDVTVSLCCDPRVSVLDGFSLAVKSGIGIVGDEVAWFVSFREGVNDLLYPVGGDQGHSGIYVIGTASTWCGRHQPRKHQPAYFKKYMYSGDNRPEITNPGTMCSNKRVIYHEGDPFFFFFFFTGHIVDTNIVIPKTTANYPLYNTFTKNRGRIKIYKPNSEEANSALAHQTGEINQRQTIQ